MSYPVSYRAGVAQDAPPVQTPELDTNVRRRSSRISVIKIWSPYINNSKYLREMVSFHSHMYADQLQLLKYYICF